ncbi:gdp-mannose transporter [Moniliophthora roreri]|nr:gdp-mannose transporter [Moniliophthora roreri]
MTAYGFLAVKAYSTPAKNPTATADTEPRVTGSPKNIIPDAATDNIGCDDDEIVPVSSAAGNPDTPSGRVGYSNSSSS